MADPFGINVGPFALRTMCLFNSESHTWISIIIHPRFDLRITSTLATFLVINMIYAGGTNGQSCGLQILRNRTYFESCPDSFFNNWIHILKAILRLCFLLHPTPQVSEKSVIPVKQSALSSSFSQATILSKMMIESSHKEALKAVYAL